MKDAYKGIASGAEFENYARALVSGERNKLIAEIAELVARGGREDCETIAAILSYSTDSADSGDYYSARYGASYDKRFVDLFLKLCGEGAIPEREYIKVLLAAGSADRSGALYRWNSAVDVYLTRRATENFELVADYMDMYDRKYKKYNVLMRINAQRAVRRLVNAVIYGKHVDKTAIRDVLMDRVELAEPLMELYGKSKAKERAAIARLLLLYKNDITVKRFIEENVAADKSKTVRDLLPSKKKMSVKLAPSDFFEQAMINGELFEYGELCEILKNAEFAAVADRIFFFVQREDGISVAVYNDGAFLDMTDKPIELSKTDRIGVLHPVDVPADCDILSFSIVQPFKQLARRTFAPPAGRVRSPLCGALTERADFDARLKACGFVLCGKRSASEPDVALKFVGDYAVGVVCEFSSALDSVACGGVHYYRREDVVKLNRTYYASPSADIYASGVPKREFSELTLAAYALFGRE